MPRLTTRRRFLGTAAAATMMPMKGRGAPAPSVGWSVYGGNQEATHYSPLTQITSANVANLRPAWVRQAPAEASGYRGGVECTPLVIDGIMYVVGASLVIEAIDAATGKPLWMYSHTSG